MANTRYGVNDALSNKAWSKRFDVEALKDTFFNAYIGTSDFALARELTELKKGAGDSITYPLMALDTSRGVTEGETLEGNETSLTTFSDTMLINELRHGVKVPARGTIDDQRVLHDSRERGYELMKYWMQDRLDRQFFNQLAGNTAETDPIYLGFNSALAPSSARVIRAGAAATDQALISSNIFVLNLIDKARNIATQASPQIRPVRNLGRDIDYVCFLHPDQVLSLRSDTTTAGNWFDLQKARLQGGEADKNALMTGAVGVYNRTLLVEATRIPQAINSSTGAAIANTRRAVFCGAQAIQVAWGKDSGPTKTRWEEETFDYKHDIGVSVGVLVGFKKTRYDGQDYGTVTIPTYAAPAS